MNPAILKYVLCLPLNFILVLAAFILAPIAALPQFVQLDVDGREWYRKPWQWISTHDTPVDTYYYGTRGRTHWLLKRYSLEDFLDKGWLRYMNRVLWIWRNPAYYAKHHWLGLHKDDPGIFLYERELKHLHIQFGWKTYRKDPDGRRMYAFRIKPEFKENWS